jgi:uncharacterized protein (TIGR00290 family)
LSPRSVEMTEKTPVLFCWSGGKDSALCLHRVLACGRYEVVALLTTVNQQHRRISMHGVREELLDAQAESIGLPLEKMYVTVDGTNEEYNAAMRSILVRYKARGVETVVFGDIFLEDLRRWREDNMAEIGMRCLFPLWQNDTSKLIADFFDLQFRAVICCVSDAYLQARDVGRELDASFVQSLPAGVDPCGENGEYHSFAFSGPIFSYALPISIGEKVYRPLEQTHATSNVCPLPVASGAVRREAKGFWFCDLALVEAEASIR